MTKQDKSNMKVKAIKLHRDEEVAYIPDIVQDLNDIKIKMNVLSNVLMKNNVIKKKDLNEEYKKEMGIIKKDIQKCVKDLEKELNKKKLEEKKQAKMKPSKLDYIG